MKRFFASLLLCTMLFSFVPSAMAENTEKASEEVSLTEETVQTERAESVQYAAAAANTATSIAFADLRKTLTMYNYNVKALNETSSTLYDSEDKIDAAVAQMNTYLSKYRTTASAMEAAATESSGTSMEGVYRNLAGLWAVNVKSMESQIESMDSQKLTVVTSQNTCNDAVNQIVKGAETLYVGILTMENAVGDVQRGIDTLERMVKLTEKQKELGMASDYDVEGMKYQYESAKSQLDSLNYQIKTSKMTLEGMLGMELTGTVSLGALTMPTEKELSEVSFEKKLDTAAGRNVDVMNADEKYYGSTEGSYEAVRAAKDSFTYQFKIICLDVPEKQRLVKVAEDAVAYQQRSFEIAAKKYEMGMLSHEEYLSAEGDLASAKSSLKSAELELFTAYRAYIWATQYGIV